MSDIFDDNVSDAPSSLEDFISKDITSMKNDLDDLVSPIDMTSKAFSEKIDLTPDKILQQIASKEFTPNKVVFKSIELMLGGAVDRAFKLYNRYSKKKIKDFKLNKKILERSFKESLASWFTSVMMSTITPEGFVENIDAAIKRDPAVVLAMNFTKENIVNMFKTNKLSKESFETVMIDIYQDKKTCNKVLKESEELEKK